MKTQISRDTHQPTSEYSGVYLQQGRMILDADWNELTDIHKARLVNALRDVLSGTIAGKDSGIGGAPREGGLHISADPAGSNNIRIEPGVLYVEGVPARLPGDTPIAVNAQPEYPLDADYDGRNLHLYADVWERSIGALEQSTLLDAALHGADTATRTRTMLQVKWCPTAMDPMDATVNPPLGDGPLTLTLLKIASSGDACDPCASQVEVDERIGNYLFRVEVHDYDANSGELILKWSRDNGAEAASATAMPDGFDQGDWVWEFYDQDTERLLGNQFATGIGKLRGLLQPNATLPAGADEPKTFVRQWDGYLHIDLSDGSIIEGRDRGADLTVGELSDPSHGRVVLEGGVLHINLELFELALDSNGSTFVPGDYWLAPVREAAHDSGDVVLDTEPPRGIRHYYLRLASLDNGGRLEPEDDAFRRSLSFPPLSDLRALDVGIDNNCPGLYGDADNLQHALDQLCVIGADDIAYPVPDCGPPGGNHLKDKLLAVLDPDADSQLTVQGALDAILCELNAHQLPYQVPACTDGSLRDLLGLAAGPADLGAVMDLLLCELNADRVPLDKTDPALCPDLQTDGVDTVQDALRMLCDRTGGSCPTKVSSPDQLRPLLDGFAESAATDLWLCLGPGDYDLGKGTEVQGKRSIRITGAGSGSVSIRLSSESFEIAGRGTVHAPALAMTATQVTLEGLSFGLGTGQSHLLLTCGQLKIEDCRFERLAAKLGEAQYSMVSVVAPEQGDCDLRIRDCRFDARYRVSTLKQLGLEQAGVTEASVLGKSFIELMKARGSGDKAVIDPALSDTADKVLTMSFRQRSAWATGIAPVIEKGPAKVPVIKAGAKDQAHASAADITRRKRSARKLASAEMAAALKDPGADAAMLAKGIGELIAKAVSLAPDCALRLGSPRVGGLIASSDLDGWLLLASEEGATVVNQDDIDQDFDGSPIKSVGRDLDLNGNKIAGVDMVLLPDESDGEGSLLKPISAYNRLSWNNNRITENPDNEEQNLAAKTWIVQGNDLGSECWISVFSEQATVVGNVGDSSGIEYPASASLEQAGNIGIEFSEV